jgi:hypothetical protein
MVMRGLGSFAPATVEAGENPAADARAASVEIDRYRLTPGSNKSLIKEGCDLSQSARPGYVRPPMPKPPNTNKTKTRPGLGSSNGLPRMGSTEIKRVRDSVRQDDGAAAEAPTGSAPRRLRDSIRRDDEGEPSSVREERISREEPTLRSDRPTARRASWEPETPTGTRPRERSLRPAVTVDEVGTTAMKIARTRREVAPKLTATRSVIAKAPIDTRAAFVLSLVDGRNTTTAIVDSSGMLEDEVKAILERLARLGLISLP